MCKPESIAEQNIFNVWIKQKHLSQICSCPAVVKEKSLAVTNRSSDAISFTIQQSANWHQVTVSLYRVVYHSRFHQKSIVSFKHPLYAFLGSFHEHARLVALHKGPHALVRWDLGLLYEIKVKVKVKMTVVLRQALLSRLYNHHYYKNKVIMA